MPSRDRTTNAIIVGNLAEVFANKKAKANITFRINEGGNCCYVVNGQEVLEEEIDARYPTEFKPRRTKGDNIDTTKFD